MCKESAELFIDVPMGVSLKIHGCFFMDYYPSFLKSIYYKYGIKVFLNRAEYVDAYVLNSGVGIGIKLIWIRFECDFLSRFVKFVKNDDGNK
jgi:hypothetical protein